MAERSRAARFLLLVPALLVAAACATRPAAPNTQAQPIADEPAATASQALTLYTTIAGTPHQRDAAEFLVNFQANHPIAVCMAEAGYEFNWSYVSEWTNWQDSSGLSFTGLLGPLHSTEASDHVQELAAANRELRDEDLAVANDGAASSASGYRDALLACQEESAGTIGGDGSPKSATQLLGLYKKTVEDAEMSLGLDAFAAYQACMKDHGIAGDTDAYSDVEADMSNDAPPLDAIPAVGNTDLGDYPEWRSFLDREEHVMAADTDCRMSVYDDGMQALAGRLGSFEQDNQDAIGQVERDWSSTVETARDAGWVPSTLVQYPDKDILSR